MTVSRLQLKQELERLYDLMLDTAHKHASLLEKLHPAQYASASNLLDYLALRSVDIRVLQDALHELGLSSLDNSESHARSQVAAVLKYFDVHKENAFPDYQSSKTLLDERARVLFGKTASDAIPAIMVTLKTIHAYDYLAVKKMLRAGMNIARINCAHDGEKAWLEMIKNVRQVSKSAGVPCKIYMDLAGPKIRTVIHKKSKRIVLEEGDQFYLAAGTLSKDHSPVVASSIPEIISQLKEGERVLFDDGLIEAKITGTGDRFVQLEVIRNSAKKPYLKAEKGINFPDSHLQLPALTDFDRKCLPFILEHADLVGYSFVHSPADLSELQTTMQDRRLPVILKIETPEGFKNLPSLLLKAMEQEYYGVMIARGDLATELGFERISEVQEEICWICEAAHTPLIWATQVLETMNKKGLATRSEITDAAFGIMAECVMLNKGPHTVQVIKMLRGILQRISGHRIKKRYLLRPLSIAREFLPASPPLAGQGASYQSY